MFKVKLANDLSQKPKACFIALCFGTLFSVLFLVLLKGGTSIVIFVLISFQDVFPDKATERKILSLAIMCPNDDCIWTGELRNKAVKTVKHYS